MTSARIFLKSLTPPILVDALGLRSGPKTYPSWDEASRAAQSYSAKTVNEFRVKRSAGRLVDGSVLCASALSLVARMVPSTAGLTVTDLGGATGDLGADFLAAFPDAQFVVVENETLVELMQGRSKVQFSKQIPASCDIFYTSGTLQYLDDPMPVLAAGFDSAKQLVAVVHNSFSDVDLFHVQTSRLFANGMGPIPEGFSDQDISYPHRTLREDQIVALAVAKGFECISRISEIEGAIDGSYGKQLVFQRHR